MYLFLKIIYLVFETFNVNLFALNHVAAFSSSIFADMISSPSLLEDLNNPVSSANKKVKKSVAFGRSFIHNKKKTGLRTLPWGTPQLTVLDDDSESLREKQQNAKFKLKTSDCDLIFSDLQKTEVYILPDIHSL